MRGLVAAGIAGAVLLAATVVAMLAWLWPALTILFDEGRVGRTYYIPSESMMPTLHLQDRIRPKLVSAGSLRRGDVIVFDGPGGARVDRIAALGGDVVELRGGRVRLNGHSASYRELGAGPVLSDGSATRLWLERLPGEAHPHRILDLGATEQDDFGPLRVPPGTLFVLGDARDRSADSRIPLDDMGVGFVPAASVVGVVDRLLWARGVRSLGRPIDEELP